MSSEVRLYDEINEDGRTLTRSFKGEWRSQGPRSSVKCQLPSWWPVTCLIPIGILICALGNGGIYQRRSSGLVVNNSVEKLSSTHQEEVYIAWTKSPDLCLDVAGGYAKNGNVLQTWTCNKHDDMIFLVSRGGVSTIRWAKHPEFCLDAPGGPDLELWRCDSGKKGNMLFQIPAGRRGFIQLANHRGKCLCLPNGRTGNELWLQVCNCDSEASDLEFTVLPVCDWDPWSGWSSCSRSCTGKSVRTRQLKHPITTLQQCQGALIEAKQCTDSDCEVHEEVHEKYARIASTEYSGKCLDIKGGYGDVLALKDCHNHPNMVFLVPGGNEVGRIRWAAHPEFCLDAAGGPNLHLWKCSRGHKKNMLFIMPDHGEGPVALKWQPHKCLGTLDTSTPQDNELSVQVVSCSSKRNINFRVQEFCRWSTWSEWSDCSKTCDEGTHHRTRKLIVENSGYKMGCVSDGSRSTESKHCSAPTCQNPPVTALIAWAKNPNQCLDVYGGFRSNGNLIRVMECSDHPDMAFTIEPNHAGRIRWEMHPDYCLDSPVNSRLQLWECAKARMENTLFSLPTGFTGPMVLAKHSDKCLHVSAEKFDKGHWLEAASCRNNSPDMQFVLHYLCRWGPWSEWTPCSRSCGRGSQTRTRKMFQEATDPKFKCDDKRTEKQNCNNIACIGAGDNVGTPAYHADPVANTFRITGRPEPTTTTVSTTGRPKPVGTLGSVSTVRTTDTPKFGGTHSSAITRGGVQVAHITWAKFPSKCLSVATDSKQNETMPVLWECHGHPEMVFMIPPNGGTGTINWALHPEFCMGAVGNRELQFWDCNFGGGENILFSMPESGTGPIKLTSGLCLYLPGNEAVDGLGFQIHNCDDADDNLFFAIQSTCKFSDWSDWSDCSEQCGWGTQSRVRRLVEKTSKGPGCDNNPIESKNCRIEECLV